MGVKFMLTSNSRKKNVNSFFILITHCSDNILNILVEIKYTAKNQIGLKFTCGLCHISAGQCCFTPCEGVQQRPQEGLPALGSEWSLLVSDPAFSNDMILGKLDFLSLFFLVCEMGCSLWSC